MSLLKPERPRSSWLGTGLCSEMERVAHPRSQGHPGATTCGGPAGAQAGNLETEEGRDVWLSVLTLENTDTDAADGRTGSSQTATYLALCVVPTCCNSFRPSQTFIQAVSFKIMQALTFFLLSQMKSRILQKAGEKKEKAADKF